MMPTTWCNVSLVEISIGCRFVVLIQSAAHFRPAGSLAEFPVFPIDISTDSGDSRRIRRRLLIACLTVRTARFLAKMIALDHGYAHVVRQRVLASVRAAARAGSP